METPPMSSAPDAPSSTSTATHPRPAPVPERGRIESLDVLRGVAVLGILVMNIQAFSMISAAYMNPSAFGSLEGIHGWVWWGSHLLTDQKFMTIFSMLFGAGIVLMTSRAEQAGGGSAGVHYRRMGWLILFGLLHAHLLWYGDILYSYGMCGLALWPLRKLRPWLLILLGILSISVASGFSIASGLSIPWWPEGQLEQMSAQSWAPPAEAVQEEIATYRGSWLDQMDQRVPMSFAFETVFFLLFIMWRAGGLMLIGMGLFKLGVFSAARSRAFYAALVAIGVLVGIPVVAYGASRNMALGWPVEYSMFFGGQFNYWASTLVSLGWVGLVMLVCTAPWGRAVTGAFAAVGRMALTNYLMHTVICTTIFYGHGFGLFGSVERAGQLGIVLVIWALQLVLSPLWLRHFQFGPVEWLWRSLTYAKAQPMRRRGAPPGEPLAAPGGSEQPDAAGTGDSGGEPSL